MLVFRDTQSCWPLWPGLAESYSGVTSSSCLFKLKKGLEYASNSSDKLQIFNSRLYLFCSDFARMMQYEVLPFGKGCKY